MGTALQYCVPPMIPRRGPSLRHTAAQLSRLSLLVLAFALASCASDSPSITAPGSVSGIRPGIAPAPVSRCPGCSFSGAAPRPVLPSFRGSVYPRSPRSALTQLLPAKPGEGEALRPAVPAASSEVPGSPSLDAFIDVPGVRRFSRPTGSPHEPHPRPPFHGMSKVPRSPVPPGLH